MLLMYETTQRLETEHLLIVFLQRSIPHGDMAVPGRRSARGIWAMGDS
jgi:hypothetical protein